MAKHVLGSKNDFPEGQGKVVEAGGKTLAVFNAGGKFYAIDNACLHQGGPLGEGKLEDKVVTCPWHGWRFNVETGVSPVNPSFKVATYKTKLEGDKLVVEF